MFEDFLKNLLLVSSQVKYLFMVKALQKYKKKAVKIYVIVENLNNGTGK